MLALAMSAGATVEELTEICLSMDTIPADRTVKTTADITPERRAFVEDNKLKIRAYLHSLGLVYTDLFDLLAPALLTNDVIDKLFQCLCVGNESLKEMFTLRVQEERTEKTGFFSSRKVVEERDRLVNYYGLLEGRLMSGQAISDIATTILASFLRRRLGEDEQLTRTLLGIVAPLPTGSALEALLRDKARALRMAEFYALSGGVEFTCTSVDLHDRVLRFFNHKTTPRMPVHKAVELTGSFPVAFEAQHWDADWGPYYVHYSRFRREIDLTGHQFTDGGMLANFPMKYLDNEDMRPMYFAHKTTSNTKIFGFGLDEIIEPNK